MTWAKVAQFGWHTRCWFVERVLRRKWWVRF